MKRTAIFALLLCTVLFASCTVKINEEPLNTKSSLDFDIQNAVIMEITVPGAAGFAQVTDDEVIAKVVDNINQLSFEPMKTHSPEGDAYLIKWYSKKAELIESIIVVSDKGILYGKNSDNYEAVSGGSIDYRFIKSLFSGE